MKDNIPTKKYVNRALRPICLKECHNEKYKNILNDILQDKKVSYLEKLQRKIDGYVKNDGLVDIKITLNPFEKKFNSEDVAKCVLYALEEEEKGNYIEWDEER